MRAYTAWRGKTCALTNRKKAAENFLESLRSMGITHTPDGAPYSVSSIRAAMVGI
jgi:hypothetical protein